MERKWMPSCCCLMSVFLFILFCNMFSVHRVEPKYSPFILCFGGVRSGRILSVCAQVELYCWLHEHILRGLVIYKAKRISSY